MNLKQRLESILFIASKFLKKAKLKEILHCNDEELESAIEELKKEYAERKSGICIMQDADRVQLITSPESSEVVKQYLKDEKTGEMTRPSLETLSIVAYRGPISKAEIEMIRGVNCSLILRNLMIRGLVVERHDKQKNIPVYQVTFELMQYLGLKELKELPDYDKLNREIKIGEVLLTQSKNSEDFFQNFNEAIENKNNE